ncbi:MAG: adenylosuccinate lyase, partial [Deltaproteobacteria bacterium]|nr:adenylosuccinate lyase [Deltaproteobacteria bacterium]
MIPRYSRDEMAHIWEPESRFKIWLKIELLACEGWERLGRVPKGTSASIRKKARFDVRRIEEIEKEVKHDVIAFLTNIAESVGPESRWLHLGLTSSDILDTCFSVQLSQALELI